MEHVDFQYSLDLFFVVSILSRHLLDKIIGIPQELENPIFVKISESSI